MDKPLPKNNKQREGKEENSTMTHKTRWKRGREREREKSYSSKQAEITLRKSANEK